MAQANSFDQSSYAEAQNILNTITYRIGNSGASRDYFIAALVENGWLNQHSVAEANRILEAKEALEEQKRKVSEAEQKSKLEAFHCPDQSYPRIFNRRNGDPSELTNWFKKTPLPDLETLLNQLKGNPYHWKSLYLSGRISDAIELLENEVAKRKNGVKN